MKEIKIKRWKSPCGELVIGSFDGRLCMCDWGRESVIRRLTRYLDAPVVEGDTCVIEETICRLEEYLRENVKILICLCCLPALIFSGMCGMR